MRARLREMKRELLDRIRAALPLDGFYLDIHGAMNVQGMDDAEADLAAAIREPGWPGCLISAGMDLHGNVSARLVELVDMFTAYRLAPHDDVLQTREKACAILLHCLDHSIRPLRAWTRIPVILPGERTSTLVEPGKSVYASLPESDGVPGIARRLALGRLRLGRRAAQRRQRRRDRHRRRPASRREAEKIARRYWDARETFDFVAPAASADWCIDRRRSPCPASGPS